MLKRMLFCGGVLLAALWLSLAAAQAPFYKSIMPDGRVIYGDKPAPGAAKVQEQKPDISKAGIQVTTPGEAAAVQRTEAARQKQEATQQNRIQAAENKLREAEAALAAGKEPQPGERKGTAGGASRLTDAYFARQRGLIAAVERARADLDKARAGK